MWQPFETINQQFALSLPADISPGIYTIVTGLYNPDDGIRLPLTAPIQNPWDHYELFQIEVVEQDE
jgi:hypothetical protein